eukprot:4218719-Heterocapsa_arctica.AAC.1
MGGLLPHRGLARPPRLARRPRRCAGLRRRLRRLPQAVRGPRHPRRRRHRPPASGVPALRQ